jgi:hypothetical protein
MNDDIIVTLDVGGKVFKTNKSTLMKSEYFNNLFNDTKIDYSNPIFLDRSYSSFKHILHFLRDNTYKFPAQYESELKYYPSEARIVVA